MQLVCVFLVQEHDAWLQQDVAHLDEVCKLQRCLLHALLAVIQASHSQQLLYARQHLIDRGVHQGECEVGLALQPSANVSQPPTCKSLQDCAVGLRSCNAGLTRCRLYGAIRSLAPRSTNSPAVTVNVSSPVASASATLQTTLYVKTHAIRPGILPLQQQADIAETEHRCWPVTFGYKSHSYMGCGRWLLRQLLAQSILSCCRP